MCHRLFIASNHPLPVVSSHGPRPRFDTWLAAPAITSLLPLPAGWQAVEAGSTSGCACDFHRRHGGARHHLACYLRPLAPRQALLLYATWYDEETSPYTRQAALPLDRLEDRGDPIPQQTLTPII